MQGPDIVLFLDGVCVVEHGNQNGWNQGEVRGAEPLDGREHVVHLELGEDDDGGAGGEEAGGEGDETVYVKHGDRADVGFDVSGVEATEDDLDHGYEVPVGGKHALAGSRGAGGVEQRGRVVLLHALPHALSAGFLLGHVVEGGYNFGVGNGWMSGGVHENDR